MRLNFRAAARGALLWAGLVLPAIFMVTFGFRQALDGLAVDGAIPISEYLARQLPLSKSFFANASRSLTSVDALDGDGKVLGAEAALRAGASPDSQINALRAGLSLAPANARGWMILYDAYSPTQPALAKSALSQSMILSQYDYWLAPPRAARLASIWPSLHGDDRNLAKRQIRLFWDSENLRPFIPALLSADTGIAAIKDVFSNDPQDLRDMNRWLSANAWRISRGGKTN